MNFYIYDEQGINVAVIFANDLIEAQKEAKLLGLENVSIERS